MFFFFFPYFKLWLVYKVRERGGEGRWGDGGSVTGCNFVILFEQDTSGISCA